MPNTNDELVVSYLTLRKMIGWIGLLMPFFVRAWAFKFEEIATTDSISAYYYTGMRDVFVSTLVLVGALLACYRSPTFHDNVVATIAGMAAIGIGLFPTDPVFAEAILRRFPEMAEKKCYLNRGILGYHSLFVGVFFALSFYLVFFNFSANTPAAPRPEKLTRNLIYKVCGVIMLLAFLTIAFMAYTNRGASIFWPETVAVVAFAVAWLVKGQMVLKDRSPDSFDDASSLPR